MTMYNRVRRLCNSQGIEISNLGEHLPDVNVAKSTINGWKNGSVPRAGVVKAIADYFDVTPEYIANGTGASTAVATPSTATDRTSVVIINGQERPLSEQEVALLKLYKELDVIQKARVIAFAAEM